MCSLQEAYLVPSFDTANSKKQIGCNVKQSGSGDYQASNEFTSDKGKEYVSFVDAWNTYGNQKETFVNVPDYQTNNYGIKKEQVSRSQNEFIGGDQIQTTAAYKGLANDTQYYCDNYQICPDVLPDNERFTNPTVTLTQNSRCNEQVPLVNANKGQGNTNSTSKLINYTTTDTQHVKDVRCLNPPQMYDGMYKNKDFDKSMYTVINQPSSCATPYKVPMRKIDMNNVKGYEEDNMDDYIRLDETSNGTTIPITRSMNSKNNLADFKDDQVKNKMQTGIEEGFQNQNHTQNQLLDILLFILAGILIIFLCEQIYKVAALSGMKQAIETLKIKF